MTQDREIELLREALRKLARADCGWSNKAKQMALFADRTLYNIDRYRQGKPGLPLPRSIRISR